MGCSESSSQVVVHNRVIQRWQVPQSIRNNHQYLIMMGPTASGDLILGFSSAGVAVMKNPHPVPRFSHALLKDGGANGINQIGYLTGGIQSIEANISSKATIESPIFQGTVSKRFTKVDLEMLKKQPQDAFKQLVDMNSPRYAHTAVYLDQGIYVMGGRQYGADDQGLLASCQFFSFTTNTWTQIAPLNVARAGAAAFVVRGNIWVLGGYSGLMKRTRIIQIYSKTKAKWIPASFRLHEGLQGLAVVRQPALSDGIVIYGGRTQAGRSDRVHLFRVDKQTVTSMELMSDSRSFHKAVTVGTDVYLLGGSSETIERYSLESQISQSLLELSYLQYCTTKQMSAFCAFQSTVIIIEPHTVRQLPVDFPEKAIMLGHAHQSFCKTIDARQLVVLNDGLTLHHECYQYSSVVRIEQKRFLIVGGISSDHSQATNSVAEYNKATETFRQLQPLKTARYGLTTCRKDEYVYAIGGRKIGSDETALLNSCERYSLSSNNWESIASLKYKRQSATILVTPNGLLVIGGYKGNGQRCNQIELYVEDQDRWVQLDRRFQLAAEAMSVVQYNEWYYIFGGRTDHGDQQQVLKVRVQFDSGARYEKSIKMEVQPAGMLTAAGYNLRLYLTQSSTVLVFGNIEGGVDIFDLKRQKALPPATLPALLKLKSSHFQPYTFIV